MNPEQRSQDIQQWSQGIAELAADALVDAKLIERSAMPKAKEIIAEEIWIRLQLGDFPSKVEA